MPVSVHAELGSKPRTLMAIMRSDPRGHQCSAVRAFHAQLTQLTTGSWPELALRGGDPVETGEIPDGGVGTRLVERAAPEPRRRTLPWRGCTVQGQPAMPLGHGAAWCHTGGVVVVGRLGGVPRAGATGRRGEVAISSSERWSRETEDACCRSTGHRGADQAPTTRRAGPLVRVPHGSALIVNQTCSSSCRRSAKLGL